MRCDSCKVECESDAKYCRHCGMEIKICPEPPAEELTAEHKSQDEAGSNPISTSMLSPDFSPQGHAKMVVPIPDRDDGSPSRRHYLLRHWQAILFPVVVLLLMLHISVTLVMLRWMLKLTPTTQASVEQVETTSGDGVIPTSSVPRTTMENSTLESPEELAARHEAEERDAKLRNQIAAQEARSANLTREITSKETRSAKLTKELVAKQRSLAIAEAALKELRQEIGLAQNELRNIDRTIARNQRELTRQSRLAARLKGKIKNLTAKASQKESVIKVLKRELALSKNADNDRRNRQTPRKGKVRTS